MWTLTVWTTITFLRYYFCGAIFAALFSRYYFCGTIFVVLTVFMVLFLWSEIWKPNLSGSFKFEISNSILYKKSRNSIIELTEVFISLFNRKINHKTPFMLFLSINCPYWMPIFNVLTECPYSMPIFNAHIQCSYSMSIFLLVI